jgi:hypothetical protein
MNEAETARDNAISFEVKKDGLQQRQSGDWQLRLTVAALDMDQRITTAPMGQRFACVLVEINDDESPVNHQAIDRNKWAELGPTKQAGIRCNDRMFWAFLQEELHFPGVQSEDTAAIAVRMHCGIESRRDLDRPGYSEARQQWYALDRAFQAWKVRENA